jgi:3-deoxy-manno-octulosonate cytidylyltransferase (CMP-KDO synthetase)
MKAIAVIPARLASTRLERKMLHAIAGEPLLAHVYRAVCSCRSLNQVVIATDSEEILALSRKNGWNATMTSVNHRSGTERVQEVSNTIAADVYVNVQGDEPLTRTEHVEALLRVMEDNSVRVGTLKTRAAEEDAHNPSAVKVVTDASGRALYFSRATIPFDRDAGAPIYYKHLGFYAYRKSALDQFVSMPESSLEKAERLEQLRFLENGIPIFVAETPYDSIGVDTKEDAERVEEILKRR